MKSIKLAMFLILAVTLMMLALGGLRVCANQPNQMRYLLSQLGFKSTEAGAPFYIEMRGYLRRLAAQADPGRVVFLGDSLTQSMDVADVDPKALNLGIGGDTTIGIRERISDYPVLGSALAVVLWVGINDFNYRGVPEIVSNFRYLLHELPRGTRVVLLEVAPISERAARGSRNNASIRALNRSLREICHGDCILVPTHDILVDPKGELSPLLHEGDGIHLNAEGYARVKRLLMRYLEEVPLHVELKGADGAVPGWCVTAAHETYP